MSLTRIDARLRTSRAASHGDSRLGHRARLRPVRSGSHLRYVRPRRAFALTIAPRRNERGAVRREVATHREAFRRAFLDAASNSATSPGSAAVSQVATGGARRTAWVGPDRLRAIAHYCPTDLVFRCYATLHIPRASTRLASLRRPAEACERVHTPCIPPAKRMRRPA